MTITKVEYSVYANSFIGHRISSHVDYEPDKEINEHFKLYNSFATSLDLKELRLDVLFKARELFGKLGTVGDWLNFNLTLNDQLNLTQRKFLLDTANFILTGSRSIEPSSWIGLMNFAKNDSSTPAKKDNLFIEPSKLKEITLDKWLSHRIGFQDIVWTLFILFGTLPKQETQYGPVMQ